MFYFLAILPLNTSFHVVVVAVVLDVNNTYIVAIIVLRNEFCILMKLNTLLELAVTTH